MGVSQWLSDGSSILTLQQQKLLSGEGSLPLQGLLDLWQRDSEWLCLRWQL